MTGLSYAALSDPGRVRQDNQDNWFAQPEVGLFGVADGMGGHMAGALASRIVAEALPSLLRKELSDAADLTDQKVVEKVLDAFARLSERVRSESDKKPALRGMGATVVAAVIREMQALIVHMGDSRAYLYRDGQLDALTRDHSLVQLLVENSAITPEQATHHPARAQVTRYLGMAGDSLPEAELHLRLRAGDRLLLCTDGLTGMVKEEAICTILLAMPKPRDACRALVAAANEAGGQDNITALIVGVAEIGSRLQTDEGKSLC